MKQKKLEIQKPVKGEPQKATLYVDDELSFINSNEIREEVLNHIKDFEILQIQANLAHIDLTGIQLLFSMKKSCEVLKKQVKFNMRLNNELRNLVIRSGFNELFE